MVDQGGSSTSRGQERALLRRRTTSAAAEVGTAGMRYVQPLTGASMSEIEQQGQRNNALGSQSGAR